MKKKLFAFVVLLCFGKLYSQEIKGKILNSKTSEAVENANIINLPSGAVTVSDAMGEFEISYEELPLRLRISALGFVNQELQIVDSTKIQQIFLVPSAEALSEVVIRSTNIPGELREVPAAVNIISRDDLERTDATNLVDNFNYVPGMFVNQGALNTNKINIRGIGARSQYSTNRIQAYFDGIPLTSAEGELTLDDIDQEALERIEVIKGPTSSMYGAGLGGSINLFSANPENTGSSAQLKSQFGSFNTLKNTVSASYGSENSSLFANYSSLSSDGYRQNGNYDRKSMLVNAKLNTQENNSLSFLANFTRLKAFIPSSINEDDFLNNPETADENWAQSQGYESYDRGLIGVSYEHSFSDDFSNVTSVYANFRDAYEPRPFDILKEERVSAGARTKFNLQTLLFGFPSELSFGAEYYNEWYETGTFENLYEDFENRGSVLGEHLSNNEQDRNYKNLFAQLNLEFSEKWKMEAGFNLNSTNYSLSDLYVQDEINQTGDYRFPTVFSPRIGTTFEVAESKNLYASISHGFSTPTLEETLTPEGQINTALKPETGINYELGFKGNWLSNNLYTEVAFYSIQVENLLVAQRVAEDRYVGVNAGKTDHNGIEFSGNYKFNLGAQISAKPYLNAAFNFFEFDEFINNDVDNSGNDLPGVPESTINMGLDLFTPWGLSFYSNFKAVGEIPLNDENSIYADNYKLVNLKAAYNFIIIDDLEINFTAGINNLFNEHYAASVLTNAVGFGGAAPRYYYPGNPRNYFAGIGIDYVF